MYFSSFHIPMHYGLLPPFCPLNIHLKRLRGIVLCCLGVSMWPFPNTYTLVLQSLCPFADHTIRIPRRISSNFISVNFQYFLFWNLLSLLSYIKNVIFCAVSRTAVLHILPSNNEQFIKDVKKDPSIKNESITIIHVPSSAPATAYRCSAVSSPASVPLQICILMCYHAFCDRPSTILSLI